MLSTEIASMRIDDVKKYVIVMVREGKLPAGEWWKSFSDVIQSIFMPILYLLYLILFYLTSLSGCIQLFLCSFLRNFQIDISIFSNYFHYYYLLYFYNVFSV